MIAIHLELAMQNSQTVSVHYCPHHARVKLAFNQISYRFYKKEIYMEPFRLIVLHHIVAQLHSMNISSAGILLLYSAVLVCLSGPCNAGSSATFVAVVFCRFREEETCNKPRYTTVHCTVLLCRALFLKASAVTAVIVMLDTLQRNRLIILTFCRYLNKFTL